jgi:phage-related protein
VRTSREPRPVGWVGTTKADLSSLPEEVQDHIGHVLWVAQCGDSHPSTKQLKGMPGVFEIVSDFDTDAYRAVYAVKFDDAIWVLHVFQKKSHKRGALPKRDREAIERRLKLLESRREAR